MTDVYVKSQKCKCKVDEDEKTLILVEGQTAVWVCTHVEAKKKLQRVEWE